MTRCPECGRRLSTERPECPLHGAFTGERLSEQPVALDAGLARALLGLGYEVKGVLGRGGFGTVYAASRTRDAQKVAIKVAARDQLDAARQLERETEALKLIGPPHVPAVFERGVIAGQCFLALELIDAPTLAARLAAPAGPPARSGLLRLALALLDAVEAVHARGVVHRDLKPENVFLCADGHVTLIDFGLARALGAAPSMGENAQGDDDIGTAEYMSPEQCDGLADADVRSDIYSIGVVLYELVAGAPPFWGKPADVREAQRSRRPPPLARATRCPPALEQVIRRCLAKDRERRYDDIASLRAALNAALAGVETRASEPTGTPRTVSRPAQPMTAQDAAPPRQRQTVGIVFFESRSGVGGVQATLSACGGQLVQTNGAQYVAAFGHDLGDNPARIALMAARRLLADGLTTRLLVDVAAVSVQVRPDGSRRVFSPVFQRRDRFPTIDEPFGVLVSAAALEVLPHLRGAPVDGRADRFILEAAPVTAEPTTFGVQLAPMVGREGLLDALLESAEHALGGFTPTLVTIAGEPGLGRSHLAGVLALALERRMPTAEVLRLAAQEEIVGAISQGLPELLRKLLALPIDPPSDGGRALLCARLGEATAGPIWAAAALVLGYIEPTHPDVQRLAAAPGALRLAAARAAGEALRGRSLRRPLALVLDDAHLADDALLDALEYATMKEAGAPVFVCVLVRPSFDRARPTWGSRAAESLRQTLAPLAHAEAIELARRALLPVEHVPAAALAKLAERTQGIPRLLVELTRGLKRDGLVRRATRGVGYYLATDELDKLPDLPIIEWNARREIDALPAQLAGHARLASVLGASFTLAEVEGLLAILERDGAAGDMQLDASVGLSRLVDSSLLVRHRDGRFAFRHALLRGTVYQQLPADRRARLHRAAYEMYGTLAMPSEQRLPRLAMHAAESGERDAACTAYLALAERAVGTHAYLEAEAAYGGALEQVGERGDERAIEALRGRGLMRSRLGRHDDAVKDLGRARTLATELGRTERVRELYLDEATVLDWALEYTRSAELVHAAEALGTGASELLAVRLAVGAARVHHRAGEPEHCVRLGGEAIARARALGDPAYETRAAALLMVAADCATLGRLDEAERYFDEVIAEAEQHTDLFHLGAAHLNRALLWSAREDVERLFADLNQCLQIARETGSALIEYVALTSIGEAAYAVDELEGALEHTERARVLARTLWGEASREFCLSELLMARICLYRRELSMAHSLVGQIRERLGEARARGDVDVAFRDLDEALLEMVALGVDTAADGLWEAHAARFGHLELQPSEKVEVLESRALAALANGDRALALRLLDAALALSATHPNLLKKRVEGQRARLAAALEREP